MNKIPFLGRLEAPFAVYFDCPGSPPLESVLRECYRDWVWKNTEDPLRSELLGDRVQAPHINLRTREEAPEPPLAHLLARGTDPARVARLSAARWVVMIEGMEKPNALRPALWATLGAALALGDELNGEIYDLAVGDLLNRRPQLPTDGEVRLSEHMNALFSLDEDGLGWLTTKGMEKFGSPELQMIGIKPHDIREMHVILQACAEQMWARVLQDELEIPSELVVGCRVAATYEGPSQPGASAFLTLTPEVGSRPSQEVVIDSELLEQAHQRAVKEFGAVASRFARGLPTGTTLSVKVGLLDPAQPGRVDFWWVQVRSWKGDTITGWLEDDEIELTPDDVYDWQLESVDGRREGAYTDAVLAEWS